MYGFDFEVVENNSENIIKVNDDYVVVGYDDEDNLECCIVGYNDNNKLVYVSELNDRWSDEESKYILNKICNNYLN